MIDDGPNYSRNVVQRRQLLMTVVTLAFISTSLFTLKAGLQLARQLPHAPDGWGKLAVVLGSVVAGVVTAALAGFAVNRIHRSLWPEHPDEG